MQKGSSRICGKVMYRLLFALILMIGTFTAVPQTNLPPNKNRAEIMREMRLKMLTAWPKDSAHKPSQDFPHVMGVLMDWPIQSTTITVVSMSTGDASIYTTGTFGVLGGIGHESVRAAAINCVKLAQQYYDEAKPTTEYPYPAPGRVRFYLVCYDGVRVMDADLNVVSQRKDRCSDLYVAAQDVVTELRLITQREKGQQQ
jgi:hypothetical protein